MPTLYTDTETNKYWLEDRSPTDHEQAVPIQVAFLLEDDDGRLVTAQSTLFSREGWAMTRRKIQIEDRCTEKHGITESMMDRFGSPPIVTFHEFRRALSHATRVVGHNIPFDVQVWEAGFAAMELPPPVWPALYCTMREATPVVRKPSRRPGGEYGWPKLGEAYFFFTKRTLVNAHDALVDTMATRVVYKKLQATAAAAPAPADPTLPAPAPAPPSPTQPAAPGAPSPAAPPPPGAVAETLG